VHSGVDVFRCTNVNKAETQRRSGKASAEILIYGMVDAQIAALEGELLAVNLGL